MSNHNICTWPSLHPLQTRYNHRLDQQGLDPLIIPHGSSWGFYTPPGTTWDKSLAASEHPEKFTLIEIYSGHGNSEEYGAWKEIIPNADGTSATCPPPTKDYLPSCWRAGDIIMERCLATGQAEAVCTKRAEEARLGYANMGVAGHLVIGGETAEDWLDAGQCTDCFLPPFNHRPSTSVQYGLAVSRFTGDPAHPTRFRWAFHRIVGQSSGASRDRLQAVRTAQEHGGGRRGGRDDAHAADPPVRWRKRQGRRFMPATWISLPVEYYLAMRPGNRVTCRTGSGTASPSGRVSSSLQNGLPESRSPWNPIRITTKPGNPTSIN